MRVLPFLAAFMLLITAAAGQEPVLPDPDDAWLLQVVTSGGIIGRGRGSFTLASDGHLRCTNASVCRGAVAPDLVRQIGEMLGAVPATAWQRQPAGTCSDCFRTTVTLRRREADGVTQHVAEWDDSHVVDARLRNAVEAVIALGGRAPVR